MDVADLATATITTAATLCTTTILPALGVLTLEKGMGVFTLAEPLVRRAPCPTPGMILQRDTNISNGPDPSLTSLGGADKQYHFSDFRDPFYASTFPIAYALAATTITSYMLVIMLFITPRSFFDGGIVYLGRRGRFTSGSSNGVTIGGRPWLQKVAALTVAISLTIATSDTTKVAQQQYKWSIQNATEMQQTVMGSLELRIIRIISSTFLWLAQAQTLIRLFPRHRERVIIKWVAFLLISLDIVFSALNSFVYTQYDILTDSRPRSFVHPVPAMNYVFQLSLGLLYAAWVMYYALMKRKYAFYHPLMKNMVMVSVISIVSIMIPIVFFILDISQPRFTGWGDYVRWVGAAAASVVVWEWVERIEALEREEKKDGVLGREVFDGDDMLEVNASDFPWLRHRRSRKSGRGGNGHGDDLEGQRAMATNGWAVIPRPRGQTSTANPPEEQQPHRTVGALLRPPIWPSRPAPAVTPVSRTETPSVASTVYAVRYQGGSEATTRTPDLQSLPHQTNEPNSHHVAPQNNSPNQEESQGDPPPITNENQNGQAVRPSRNTNNRPSAHTENVALPRRWRALTASAGPFFHRSSTDDQPPAEVVGHVAENTTEPPRRDRHNVSSAGWWDVRARLEHFAANQADKLRDKLKSSTDTENLPVTVIPAPERPGAALQQVLEEEEEQNQAALMEANAEANAHIRDGSNGIGHGQARVRQFSSGDTSTEASLDMARAEWHAGTPQSMPTRNSSQVPIPATNPPLWPGVHRRTITYEDDDELFEDEDDDSSSSLAEDLSSIISGDRDAAEHRSTSAPSSRPPVG